MTLTLFGIKNCDTVKKARRYLDEQNVAYTFHDFRSDGLDADRVRGWIAERGWETVINRRSSSWKTLSESERQAMDDARAVEAAVALPTLIKRPVLQSADHLEIGFNAARYAELLG